MRTIYAVSRPTPGVERWEQLPGQYGSMPEAFAAAGRPDESDWFLWDDPRWRLQPEVRAATGIDAIITPERLPDTDADRMELATEVLLSFGHFDGDHHKMWAIDQALRLLLGDRYDQAIAEWRNGEDGPETYDWDTGIAP